MKKSAIRLMMFGAIACISLTTSCKSGGGYGCDYTQVKAPIEKEGQELHKETDSKSKYYMIRNVTE